MVDYNLSLDQFRNISNGSQNAGQIDVQTDGRTQEGAQKYKLSKINNHVTMRFLNTTKMSDEKIIDIKESFVKALKDNHASEALLKEVRKELGLDLSMGNTQEQSKSILERRFAPLTRQQVKDILKALDQKSDHIQNQLNAVQQRVLNGLPKNLDNKLLKDILVKVSYLTTNKFSEHFSAENGDCLAKLKRFAKMPISLARLHTVISKMDNKFWEMDQGNRSLDQTIWLDDNKSNSNCIHFHLIEDEDGDNRMTATLMIDNHPIEIDFGMSANQYIDNLAEKLTDFMDVLPDVKDANDLSLGRGYLKNALDDLATMCPENELNSTAANSLRTMCLSILEKTSQNPPDDLYNLPNSCLKTIAELNLVASYSPDDLNKLINNFAASLKATADNLQPNQLNRPEIQGGEPQHANNINNVQIPDEIHDNEIYQVIKYTDSKPVVSFINQIFDTFMESLHAEKNQAPDLNKFKNLVTQNLDILLSLHAFKADTKAYEIQENNKTVLISPKLQRGELREILKTLAADYTKATGKVLDLDHLTLTQVDDLRSFVANATAEQLNSTMVKASTCVTATSIHRQAENLISTTDDKQMANAISKRKDRIQPYSDITFTGYSSSKTVKSFISGLARLAKGGDPAKVQEYLSVYHKSFLTFLAGRYDEQDLPENYRDAFKQIRTDFCTRLAELTGIESLKQAPDFAMLSPLELTKVMARLSDHNLISELTQACGQVTLTLADFNGFMQSEFNKVKTETNPLADPLVKERTAQQKIQNDAFMNVVKKNGQTRKFGDLHSSAAGDLISSNRKQAITQVIATGADEVEAVPDFENILPSSAVNFIHAEQQSVRKAVSFFMTLSKTGTKEEQQAALLKFMKNNGDALFTAALKDLDYLKQCLSPQMHGMAEQIHTMLRETLSILCSDIRTNENYKEKAARKSFDINLLHYADYQKIHDYFNYKVEKDSVAFNAVAEKVFANLNAKLPQLCTQAAQQFQNVINQIFKIDKDLKVSNDYDKMSAQEIKDQLSKKNVDEIIQDNLNSTKRPGKHTFNLLVLKNYFTQMPQEEIAKILEEAVQAEPDANGNGQPTVTGTKRLLSMLLKGAGPLLQKMLQGMNKDLIDSKYSDVLDELKSSLTHIDREYAENLIQKNFDKLKIRVSLGDSIGAATIAETFHCELHIKTFIEGIGFRDNVKNVVVKIMRPGIKQRAENELKIFNEAAKQVPGMTEEWNTQYQSILKEFDFINEAHNIDECHNIYEVKSNHDSKDKNIAPNVSSLTRDKDIPVQNEVIMTNLIEGETAEKKIVPIAQELKAEFEKVFKFDSETGNVQLDKNGHPIVRDDVRFLDILLLRKFAKYNFKEIFAFNGLLTQVAAKWIKEALFGSGVLHNDVHGGNLMISENMNQVTFIDFGNVERLTPDTQLKLKDLLVYTLHRDSAKFMDTIKSLIPHELTAQQQEKMTAIVDAILQKGHSTDDAGFRLSAIISELRNLNITFSSDIYAFTNGLSRMQNFAANANKQIKEYEAIYQAVMGVKPTSSYKLPDAEAEKEIAGNFFTEILDSVMHDWVKAGSDLIDSKLKEIKADKSELMQKMSAKILTDAFETDFKYCDKFIERYRQYLDFKPEELKGEKFVILYSSFRDKVAQAKAAGIDVQLLKNQLANPDSPLPEGQAQHKDLINEVIHSLQQVREGFKEAMQKTVRRFKRDIDDNPTEVSYLPTTSADGKVSSVFDHNIVSVEAELGKLLTQVNNFSMAKNSNPTMVVNDILQPQGGKPIVEVTQNPGGHGSSAA